MSQLLRMYLYRLRHSKMFYVFLALAFLTALATTAIEAEANAQEAIYDSGPSFSIGSLLMGATDFGSWPTILGPALISFFFALEWKDGTFRNQILAGKSRTEMFLSGQIVGLIISLSVFLADFLPSLLFGLLFRMPFFLTGVDTGSFWTALGMIFFLGLFLSSLATSLAFLVRNSWGAFGCFIGFLILASTVYLFTVILEAANFDVYYECHEFLYSYQVSKFQSLSFDSLTIWRHGAQSPIIVMGRSNWLIAKTFISSLLIGGGVGYGAWRSFLKRDIR
jgi:ABC-2 type transport system permease protein